MKERKFSKRDRERETLVNKKNSLVNKREIVGNMREMLGNMRLILGNMRENLDFRELNQSNNKCQMISFRKYITNNPDNKCPHLSTLDFRKLVGSE